jgi:hypothetical protein
MPIFNRSTSANVYDRDSNPRSSALEADTMTFVPRRQDTYLPMYICMVFQCFFFTEPQH